MWDPYAEFSSFTLPNGLTVYHREIDRPWIICHAIVHAGAYQDPIGKEGVAHYFEHILGDNIPLVTREELTAHIEDRGGKIMWGETGLMFTRYIFKVPLEIAARVIDTFGAMLFCAHIEHAIAREQAVILQEFNSYFQGEALYRIRQDFYQKLYTPNSRRGRAHSPLGDPNTIAAIDAGDLQSFYDHYYVPANISLVVTSGLSSSELEKMLTESAMAQKKSGTRVAPLASEMPACGTALPRVISRSLSEILHMSSERGTFWSVGLLPGSSNPAGVRILSDMLRDFLYEVVRKENQWAYSVSVQREHVQNFTELHINIPLATEGFELITDIADAAIDRIRREQDLFEKKRRICLAAAALADMNNGTIAENVAQDIAALQRIELLRAWQVQYEDLTFQDIVDLSAYLSPDRRWTLLQRP